MYDLFNKMQPQLSAVHSLPPEMLSEANAWGRGGGQNLEVEAKAKANIKEA